MALYGISIQVKGMLALLQQHVAVAFTLQKWQIVLSPEILFYKTNSWTAETKTLCLHNTVRRMSYTIIFFFFFRLLKCICTPNNSFLESPTDLLQNSRQNTLNPYSTTWCISTPNNSFLESPKELLQNSLQSALNSYSTTWLNAYIVLVLDLQRHGAVRTILVFGGFILVKMLTQNKHDPFT